MLVNSRYSTPDSVFLSNLFAKSGRASPHLSVPGEPDGGGKRLGSELPGGDGTRARAQIEHPLTPERLVAEHGHDDRRQAST